MPRFCDFCVDPYIRMNDFGSLVYFSLFLSGFYDTFDNKAIKFLFGGNKYYEAFGGIACFIAIIICAYVNTKH